MHFETTVEIHAPHDRVWATLVDVERWPEWTASMREVTPIDERPLARGSRVRIKQPRMPSMVWEVTDLDTGASFAWRSASPGVATVGTHLVEETAADTVTITFGIDQSGPMAPIVGLLTGSRTKRYIQMEAEGLKTRAERTP
jgi:uncharacterized membrane protein